MEGATDELDDGEWWLRPHEPPKKSTVYSPRSSNKQDLASLSPRNNQNVLTSPAHTRKMLGLPQVEEETKDQTAHVAAAVAANSPFLERAMPPDRETVFKLAAQFINDGHSGRPLRCELSSRPDLERMSSSWLGRVIKLMVLVVGVVDMGWPTLDLAVCTIFAFVFLLYALGKCAVHGTLSWYASTWNKAELILVVAHLMLVVASHALSNPDGAK